MLNNRKSDMSISLMVAVVIALIVIVVVSTIFGKSSGEAARTLQSCESRGGSCNSGSSCPEGQARIPNAECPEKGKTCCLKV